MSSSFLTIWWPFFLHFGNFHCFDCLVDHQKLNIIQKRVFHFLTIWQPFFFWLKIWALLLLGSLECNPKMSISFLDNLAAIFWHFGNFCHLHCSTDHQKLNVIQNKHFFYGAGEGWQMGFESINQPSPSSEIEHNPKMSFSFFRAGEGWQTGFKSIDQPS